MAARFLPVERDAIIRWVEAGRMGVTLPGVPGGHFAAIVEHYATTYIIGAWHNVACDKLSP